MDNELKRKELKLKDLNLKNDVLLLDKLDLIDFAFQEVISNPQSFSDLGGVWNVEGGYTFYTLEKYPMKSGFLVDLFFTDEVKKRADSYDNLTMINGNFGDNKVLEQLNSVDAIFLFDVLLHQVNPNWDDILELYSSVTDCFVIYNQQFLSSENTVRLLDLGYDEYFENTPHNKDELTVNAVFDNMYEVHPTQERIWKDIPNVWQWGITDSDLVHKMDDLGYSLEYYKNIGKRDYQTENWEDHAFIFQKE